MSVINDLYNLIDASGAVDNYEKRVIWNEQYTNPEDAYIVCRRNGLPSDEYERNQSFAIWLIGATNESDVQGIGEDANNLVKYFLQNYTEGCIINVELVGDIAGPDQLDSGRYLYKFDVNVKSATS